jgi:predicted Zn-dependent peptidase
MKTTTMCAALALCAPSLAWAQGRPGKPSEFSPNVPSYELSTTVLDLPSGMRVMFQPDHAHPVVGAFAVVNHGTKDDPEGKEELAHFAEHTWFRSAQLNFPSIMSFVFDYGTLFNATTRNDWTDYRTVANAKYLETLLKLENARLNSAYKGVTEEMIDTEREVIRNEWRRRNEQNQALFFDYMYESIYPKDHPYHDHSTHGSIDNIKLADLQKFFDDYYKPETTTLFVVGDFDERPESIIDMLLRNFDLKNLDPRLTDADVFVVPRDEYPDARPSCPEKDKTCVPDTDMSHYWYAAWDPVLKDEKGERLLWSITYPRDKDGNITVATRPPRITSEPTPVYPPGTKEVLTRQGPFDRKTVAIGWSLPGGFREDSWNLIVLGNVASSVVANGLSGLSQAKKVGDVGCFAQPEVINTTMVCYAELLDSDLDPLMVRDEMLDQFSELWNPENLMGTGMGAQFFNQSMQRGKLESLAGTLLELDLFAQVFGGRAETLVPHAHYNDYLHSGTAFSDSMNAYMQMEPAKISKLAYEYLKRDRAATVILEPLPEDEIDVGSEQSSYSGSNVTDSALAFSGDLGTVTEEAIAADYLAPSLEGLVDYTMPNGLRVVILPHGVAPIVEARLMLGRNADAEDKGQLAFVRDFTASTGNDPLPIAAQTSWFVFPGSPGVQAAKGFPMSTGLIRSNSVMFDVKAPSGNLDGALWLLRDEMETAHPDMDGLSTYFKNLKEDIEGNWSDPDWHTGDAVSKYLFPTSPARQTMTWEEMEAQRTWGPDRVANYLAQTMQPSNATLVVVGLIPDVEQAKKDIETYFGGWQARNNAPAPAAKLDVPALPTDASKILIFDDPKRTQSDVTMYCRLSLQGGAEEEAAVQLLDSLMGDRIFNEIRVHRGLAYSPGAAAFVDDDGAGRAIFYSDGVVNRGAGEILAYYKQVVSEVQSGKFDKNELLVSKIRNARRDGLAWQSVGQVTDNLSDLVAEGKPFDYVKGKGERLAKVDVAQVSRLLDDCAVHNITTIEGPKDVVAPQLDELGMAYEVVEWRANGDDLLWKYDPKEAKKKQKSKLKAEKKKAKETAKDQPEEQPAEPTEPAPTGS